MCANTSVCWMVDGHPPSLTHPTTQHSPPLSPHPHFLFVSGVTQSSMKRLRYLSVQTSVHSTPRWVGQNVVITFFVISEVGVQLPEWRRALIYIYMYACIHVCTGKNRCTRKFSPSIGGSFRIVLEERKQQQRYLS